MFERYSDVAKQALFIARTEAGASGCESIHSEHLLICILIVHPELFTQLGVIIESDELRIQIKEWHPPSAPVPTDQDMPLSPSLQAVFDRAPAIADEQQCAQIRTEHILLSMFDQPCHAGQFLAGRGISKDRLSALVASADYSTPQKPTAFANEAVRSLMGGVFS
jgi:ATP-dependent Clp protease ATP-binding subunit ClpA